MNAESFTDYLAQPAKLYQLSYQEIKNLVAEYPFSANLRYLLLLKAKIEQDPNFEHYLHQYAAHSPDREALYRLLHEQLPQILDLEISPEERLELLDLGSFQQKEAILLEDQPATSADEQALESTFTPPANPTRTEADDEPENTSAPKPLSPTEQPPVPANEVATEADAPLAQETAGADEAPAAAQGKPLPEPAAPAVAPLPKTAFDCWSPEPSPTSARERFGRLRQQNLRARTTGSEARVRKVAKESIAEPTELASETLAILLERQGQYERAIEMYERLSLLNPEKSRYFAAAIEKLKLKV